MGGSAMEKMIRMCLNWKVIGGLSVVGLGIWLVAPNLITAAIPILLIAVCPPSMLVMMKAMDGGHRSSRSSEAGIVDGVAPSRDVRIAELQAQKELLDSRISLLREEMSDTPGAPIDIREERDGRLTMISYPPS
jgi:hypothetical protein